MDSPDVLCSLDVMRNELGWMIWDYIEQKQRSIRKNHFVFPRKLKTQIIAAITRRTTTQKKSVKVIGMRKKFFHGRNKVYETDMTLKLSSVGYV